MIVKNSNLNKQTIIKSYGILCLREYQDGLYESLLVQRRCTQHFSAFVLGKYGDKDLMELFNNMTIEEKRLIALFNFSLIWNRLMYGNATCYETYCKKFDDTFSNKKQSLLQMLSFSKTGEKQWEVPKGRRKNGESPKDCAIREFGEETGITKNQYYLLDKSITTSTTHQNYIYQQVFYIAIMNNIKFEPSLKIIPNEQMNEISDVKWFSLQKLKLLELYNSSTLKRVFIKSIKMLKQFKSYNYIVETPISEL